MRTFGQKKYANIYDVVVLPSIQTPGLAEIELRRFYEYARLALNRDELIPEFEDRVAEYGLVLEEVTNFLGNDTEEAVQFRLYSSTASSVSLPKKLYSI